MGNNTPKFTKKQIISSNKFKRIDKDILSSLLEDSKFYTLDECEKIIKQFKKKGVK